MKKQILARLKEWKKKWMKDGAQEFGVAHSLYSIYQRMNRPLSIPRPELKASEDPSFPYQEERPWQAVAGCLTGKILADLGVITAEQFSEALNKQRELQAGGRRKSLGILLVEMGYTTSKEYLGALSRYFGLPIISLLKFIPSPTAQSLLADRYVHHHRLLILGDEGSEVTMALAEPDPLILEDLKKAFRHKERINFYLVNPFELERCYVRLPDPYWANFYR